MEFKKNVVKCDIGSYTHLIRGIKKSGKTTLFRDIVLEEYGKPEAGLHISLGNETGAKALDEIYTVEASNWSELREIVDELVENKEDHEFKIVCLDTVDEFVKIASAEVIRLHRIKKGEKIDSLNEAFGGYGRGREKLVELIDSIIASLKKAGYGVFMIGHTKLRDVKEKTGAEYQQLKSNLTQDYDDIFSNQADIIMTITVDKQIEDGVIVGTERYMHFRDDGFIDCGSRLAGMPEKVEYGAREYIDAVNEGVRASVKNKITKKDFDKRKADEAKEREQEGIKFSKKSKENKVDEDKNSEIIKKITENIKELSEDERSEKADVIREVKKEFSISKFTELIDRPTKDVEEIYNRIFG